MYEQLPYLLEFSSYFEDVHDRGPFHSAPSRRAALASAGVSAGRSSSIIATMADTCGVA